jgi:hypothetical protein
MVMQIRPRAARLRRLSQSLPKNDSGLTLRIKFISAAAHICLPQRTQKSAGNLFDHDVGDGHERFGNSNLLADFSLGARADNWRVPYLGLTSRRLIEGPGDGLNEHPQPSHHRHCNCGKVEQFDHAGTHADSTRARSRSCYVRSPTSALRANSGSCHCGVHAPRSKRPFRFPHESPKALQFQIALGNGLVRRSC